MKKLRWPLIIATLALAAIALLLISRQPAALTPIDEPVVAPAAGGIYAEGLIGSLVRLNPVLDYYNPADRDVDRLIFNGLLRFDDRGFPHGELADSWGISRDGTTYNFTLRANAAWHDGQPVTSDDVLYTIEMMRSAGSPLPEDLIEFWNSVDVEPLDEKTIQFRLPEAFAPFLDYLSFGVLPSHLLGELTIDELIDSPFNLQPVGSGPYQFDHFIMEEGEIVGLVLRADQDYYHAPPFIEQIAFRYYPDAQAALAAYQAGEIGGIAQVTSEILPQVLAEPELSIYTSRLPQITIIFLNLDHPSVPFFQELAVRQALLSGLNRQWMVDNLLNSQAIIADGVILPGTWAYYSGNPRVAYNADQAKTQLRQAGYTIPSQGGGVRENEEGLALSFELLYPDDATHQAIAVAVQQDWAQIGVEVTLKAVPYDELVTNYLDTRQYQAALADINLSRSPDPDPYPFWHQAQISGGQNYSKWDDRSASEFLEQARVTTDMEERTRLYNNFQVRFNQELPALPLFYPVYSYAVSADVQGVLIGPLFDAADRFNSLASWFLVTRRAGEGEAVTPTP
ncbi:MAG: peptide ABC transporter substrate-binding protein [Anaerolineales bacterium]|nr:peptide ABC transporter substrate-binding protein [Anaerolineales bacterium]